MKVALVIADPLNEIPLRIGGLEHVNSTRVNIRSAVKPLRR